MLAWLRAAPVPARDVLGFVVPLVVGAALVRARRHPVVDGLFAA